MASATQALGASNLLDIMSKSLPPQNPGRIVKSTYSAIALLCHASMLAVGFRLVGLGEDHKIDAQSDSTNLHPLPAEWDAQDSFAFRYKHSQSSMEHLLKVIRLGNKALIHAMGIGHDKTASFEVMADDFTSQGSIQETANDTNTNIQESLKHVFISSGRLTDFASKFRSEIIQKLVPGIRKEGYEEPTTHEQPIRPEAASNRDPHRPHDLDPEPARPYPFDDPLAIPPLRQPRPVPDFQPPGFEDEYEIGAPPHRLLPGGRTPFGNIGEQDLYPPGLAPHDPLRIGPGAGRRTGGGGMHPTFDDPIFGGGYGGDFGSHVPPGARYDPVGPGDGPRSGNLGGGRYPGGRGGGPPNPFGGFGAGDFI